MRGLPAEIEAKLDRLHSGEVVKPGETDQLIQRHCASQQLHSVIPVRNKPYPISGIYFCSPKP